MVIYTKWNDKMDTTLKRFFGKDSESIFKDKRTLEITFVPKELADRTKEKEDVARFIGSIMNCQGNLSIVGTVGSGKTACTRYIIDIFNEEMRRIGKTNRAIYINATEANNASQFYSKLLSELGEKAPERGWYTSEYLKRIKGKIIEVENLIACLDEAQNIVEKGYEEVLRHLHEYGASIITISNRLKWDRLLDIAIKDRMQFQYLLFPPYTYEQLYQILQQRCEISLVEGVTAFPEGGGVNEEIHRIAYVSSKQGNSRSAMVWLKLACEEIDMSNPVLTLEYVENGRVRLEDELEKIMIKAMPQQQQVLLLAICLVIVDKAQRLPYADKITMVDVRACVVGYKTLIKELEYSHALREMSERQIQNYLQELESHDIIQRDIIYGHRGERGRRSMVGLVDSEGEAIQRFVDALRSNLRFEEE